MGSGGCEVVLATPGSRAPRARQLNWPAGALVAVLVALVWVLGTPAIASAEEEEEVHLTRQQVSQALFVAGDVARLSDPREGTKQLVFEKALQQIFADEPEIERETAESYVIAMKHALAWKGSPTNASLELMSGNQRVLAILAALERPYGEPTVVLPAAAKLAVTHLAAAALTGASEALAGSRYFEPLADSRSTLLYTSFSPATVLRDTRRMASSNHAFGAARDYLWKSASGESVFSEWPALFEESPVLHLPSSFSALAGEVEAEPDEGLTTTPAKLIENFEVGRRTAEDQLCEHNGNAAQEKEIGVNQPEGGATIPGVPREKCSGGALRDASEAKQAANKPDEELKLKESQKRSEERAAVIEKQRALMASAAELLRPAEAQGAAVLAAEAQAQSDISEGEEKWTEHEEKLAIAHGVKSGLQFAATLGSAIWDFTEEKYSEAAQSLTTACLSIWELVEEPTAESPPNTEDLTLKSVNKLREQMAGFQQYTQEAFRAVSLQVGQLRSQVAQESFEVQGVKLEIGALAQRLAATQQTILQLENRTQTLFAAQVNSELQTAIVDSAGWLRRTGEVLSPAKVHESLVALYKYGTEVANGVLVNHESPPFTFEGASMALGRAGEPQELSEYANYLTRFPVEEGWLAGPVPSSQANATFWDEAARAYAQVMLENPSRASASDIEKLAGLEREGETLARARRPLSEGGHGGATGNVVLNELLAKAEQAVVGDGSGNGVEGNEPLLKQAEEAAKKTFLQRVEATSGVSGDPTKLNLWGGVFQGFYPKPEMESVVNAHYPALELSNAGRFFGVEETKQLPWEITTAIRAGIVTACGSKEPVATAPCGTGTGASTWQVNFETDPKDGIFPSDGELLCSRMRLWKGTTLYYDGFCTLEPPNIRKIIEEELARLQGDAYLSVAEALKAEPAPTEMLAGARALTQAYVELGLPQALSGDPLLERDISGPGVQFLDPEPNTSSPRPVGAEIQALISSWISKVKKNPEEVTTDFLTELKSATQAWAKEVAAHAKPFVEDKVPGSGTPPSGTEHVSEQTRLIESTVNRLLLTQDVFEESKAPTAETIAPTDIGVTEATLKGEVDPYGAEVETCKFEYGSTQTYGHSLPCANKPDPSYEPSLVSAKLTGWTPEGGLHERLVVKTWAGTTYGEDVQVQLAQALRAETGITRRASKTTAWMTGVVYPHGSDVKVCRFFLRRVGQLGELIQAACRKQVGAGTVPVPVAAKIKSLEPGTNYEYWLQAVNGAGEASSGTPSTFTTKPGTRVGLRTSGGELGAGSPMTLVLRDFYLGTSGPGGKYLYCNAGGLTGTVTKIGTKSEVRFDEGVFLGEEVESRCGVTFNWNFEATVFPKLPWNLVFTKGRSGELQFSLGAVTGRTMLEPQLSEPEEQCVYTLPSRQRMAASTSFGPLDALSVPLTPIELTEASGVGECDTEAPVLQGTFELQSEGLQVTSFLK